MTQFTAPTLEKGEHIATFLSHEMRNQEQKCGWNRWTARGRVEWGGLLMKAK